MAAVTPARYTIPRRTSIPTSSTNVANSKTTTGRPSLFHKHTIPRDAASLSMSDSWNPHALPFRPGAIDQQQQNPGGFANQYPPPPPPPPGSQGPHGQPGVQCNTNLVLPPPPPRPPQPHMFNNAQEYDCAVFQHAQLSHHWMMHMCYGQPVPPPPIFPPGPAAFAVRPPHVQPHGPLLFGQPSYAPPPFVPQQQSRMFTDQAQHRVEDSQIHVSHGATNEDMQYVFDAFKCLKSRNPNANIQSTPTLPGNPQRTGPAANGHDEQNEYDALPYIDSHKVANGRINKKPRASKGPKLSAPSTEKKGRYGDKKIMLPPPQPTEEYMSQAAEEPSTNETPGPILVILDLNGTVLYRPNRNAKTMIERPFLKPFLRYLFGNFKVMVWSSARPDNVKALVNKALDEELRSKLVAQWARDSFGLSPANYQLNVQVYKNLKLVWSRSQIQSHHPDFETGGRFGQHNTVLIDDSALKANAQPYNLLEIPEFSATPEQMQGDVLREVAGYLEALRYQSDVSKFIRKHPFVEGGQWTFDWPDDAAGGGEVTGDIPAAPLSKKERKRQAKAAAAAAAATATNNATTPLAQPSLRQNPRSLASGPIAGSIQGDW
ncbi:HAD-like protein [Curvularia clavata]|uniref:HAD-like protein n=1 Tax=Curvularia clavata TaxID=95742 RepID=A0A9Q8ZCL1_CURCL|nr:HAD-like protein [Curvularia clavata]